METGPFTIDSTTAEPGTATSGTFNIAPHGGDTGTFLPFSILRGTSDGPVLLLTAGVHGMEYAPVIALQRLRASIDPKTLRGTVLMVHVVNMPSFLGRTVYYSPIDGHNQNRVFPGRADGTVSERIAHAVTELFISRATHVLDLHGGDANESLRPYSYWITSGDRAVTDATRALALAFGLDHIVVDNERPKDPSISVYLSNTAITRGKPAVTTEAGCLGEVEEAAIAMIERGVAGVLKHLGMRADGPAPVAHPVWLKRNDVLRSRSTGLFYAAVAREDVVAKGTLIGYVTDFHGRRVEDVHAPFGGQIMYVVTTPPIRVGEPVAMVSAID